MGNWSINPNTLASIDDNGKATFQEHTQDTNYTITYNDGTSGSITKTFTVYACSQPPVDCSKYGFTANTISEAPSVANSQQLAFSIASEGVLTATVVEGSDVVTGITAPTAGPYYQYIGWFAENQSTSPKHAKIRYTSSDGCEWEQTVTQKGVVDCSKYGFEVTSNIIPSSGGDKVLAESVYRKGQLTFDAASSAPWITEGIPISTTDTIYYHFNVNSNSGLRREGALVFTSNDGCEFSGTVIQAAQATAVHITFTGLPSNLTSGGLSMTGSTYTAQFILAGPNAGTGTLYGIFSPSDSRRVMTFSGQFTSQTSGGNIVNACDGTSTYNIYTVYTASWNATARTLNVTFGACS